MFEKFLPVDGGSTLDNIKILHKAARRIGQYKVGENVLFYPDGTYVILSEVTSPQFDTATVTTKGCCGVVLENPAVIFYVGDKKHRVMADNEKQAKMLMSAFLDGAEK